MIWLSRQNRMSLTVLIEFSVRYHSRKTVTISFILGTDPSTIWSGCCRMDLSYLHASSYEPLMVIRSRCLPRPMSITHHFPGSFFDFVGWGRTLITCICSSKLRRYWISKSLYFVKFYRMKSFCLLYRVLPYKNRQIKYFQMSAFLDISGHQRLIVVR